MTPTFNPDLSAVLPLPAAESWPPVKHQFDARSVWAVRAALAARRPLLVRGEPGIGKSQLARAAAYVLKVPFLFQVINAATECGDLLFTYDAVSRLAQAQVLSAAGQTANWEERLADERFVRPGVLWWAFDWNSAKEQAERFCCPCLEPAHPEDWSPGQGCVVLIDEIDKADSDVPNSLLESLGNSGFQVPLAGRGVALPEKAVNPLVIITTNEERELPAAFVRRCLVLHLGLPEKEDEQQEFLLSRGRVQFGNDVGSDEVYRRVARQLREDRQAAREKGQALPGAAEYLDLLRALVELHPGDESAQLAALSEIRGFAFRKYSGEPSA